MIEIMRKQTIFCFFCAFFVAAGMISCAKPGDNTVRQAMQALGTGEYDTALQFFTQALEEDTNYSPELLYTFIANVYVNQGEYQKAIAAQESSLALRAEYRGFVSLGMLHHLVKDDEKAAAAYRNAIALDGKKAEAYASLGALYLGQDDTAQAIPLLEKAAALEPNIAVIQANLAVAYAFAGEREKSDAALEKARALKCENIEQFEEKIADRQDSSRQFAPAP